MRYRIGVDVGGTFADVLLPEETSGTTFRAKTPSTSADQSVGVTSGCIRASATDALQHGFRPLVVSDALTHPAFRVRLTHNQSFRAHAAGRNTPERVAL